MVKKKVKFTSFGRGFSIPFVEPDYFQSKTYEDVIKAVKKDIKNDIYNWTFPAKGIRLKKDANLTSALKLFLPICPDLFESNSPEARKLVAHFGRLLNTSLYGQNSRERKKAEDDIKEIVNTKTPYAKGSKVYIPPFLSLNDMCAYIHQITKYLKEQYTKSIGYEPLNENYINDSTTLKTLKEADKRLVKICTAGHCEMLINKPKELTKTFVADFFGLTVNGLKQQLKEEISHPNTCHSKW